MSIMVMTSPFEKMAKRTRGKPGAGMYMYNNTCMYPPPYMAGVEYVTQIARASEEVIAANRAARKVPETPLEIWCTDVR